MLSPALPLQRAIFRAPLSGAHPLRVPAGWSDAAVRPLAVWHPALPRSLAPLPPSPPRHPCPFFLSLPRVQLPSGKAHCHACTLWRGEQQQPVPRPGTFIPACQLLENLVCQCRRGYCKLLQQLMPKAIILVLVFLTSVFCVCVCEN